MKKLFVIILAALPCAAFAINPYDTLITQRNAANTSNFITFIPVPSASADGVLMLNGLTSVAEYATLGHGLGFGSGQLIITGLTASDVAGVTEIQKSRAQTDASGNYTWTYPSAYGGGIVPIIGVVPEGGSTVPLNVQIVGTPTNTAVTFKVLSLPNISILGIATLGAPTGTQAYLHMTAIAP